MRLSKNFKNYIHEHRSALPVHSPPCGVPRYTAQSAESSTALSQFQRSARLARHRRSGAALRVLCRKCCQPLFEIGVVGLHLNDAAILVKIDHSYLLLFGKPCSHKTSCIKKAATTISEVVTAFATRCHTPARSPTLPPRRSGANRA